MLAAKASLAIRYDALGEDTNSEMGLENRAKLEARLRQLEEKGVSATLLRLERVAGMYLDSLVV